ncbi:unnamed protein product, partial [Urochloa humidicola]
WRRAARRGSSRTSGTSWTTSSSGPSAWPRCCCGRSGPLRSRPLSTALWLRELRDLEHAAEDVLEELEFKALRAVRLEGFEAQLLRSYAGGSGKRKREISLMYSSSPDRGGWLARRWREGPARRG